jgi:hypothetical protein
VINVWQIFEPPRRTFRLQNGKEKKAKNVDVKLPRCFPIKGGTAIAT